MENHWLGQRVKRDYGDRYEKETPYSVYTKAPYNKSETCKY